MAFSPAGSIAPPLGSRTLKPLSCGGLWLAVMLIAPNALRSVTPNEITGVGTPPPQKCTGMPLAANTSAAAAAKSSERKRLSPPITAPRANSPGISCLQIVGKTLRTAADVVKGVVLCDAGPPAVGAEDDVGHG